jgi:hypothetical protein
MLSNAPVYIGLWTNYAKRSVYGSTLTLSNRDGVILIAALAIFIQVCVCQVFCSAITLLRSNLDHQ